MKISKKFIPVYGNYSLLGFVDKTMCLYSVIKAPKCCYYSRSGYDYGTVIVQQMDSPLRYKKQEKKKRKEERVSRNHPESAH